MAQTSRLRMNRILDYRLRREDRYETRDYRFGARHGTWEYRPGTGRGKHLQGKVRQLSWRGGSGKRKGAAQGGGNGEERRRDCGHADQGRRDEVSAYQAYDRYDGGAGEGC